MTEQASLTVIVSRSYGQPLLERMRARTPYARFVRMEQNGDVPESGRDAIALLRCSMSKPEFSNALSQAPNLRWVHTCTAGFDQLLVPEIVERQLLVTRSGETHHIVIAEWAMASLLAIAKQFPFAYEAQANHRWIGPAGWPEPVEFYGATMGIIGAGAIGTEVAKRARGFGMRVLGTKRKPEQSEWFDKILPSSDVNSLLRESDFVVVAAPLTPQTRDMIGTAEFAIMKSTSYLCNIARGAIVNERMLINALESGQIAGAALDVFVDEPLGAENPLWSTKNVMITPHASARSAVSPLRGLEEFAVNLDLFRRNEPLNHMLSDPTLGY